MARSGRGSVHAMHPPAGRSAFVAALLAAVLGLAMACLGPAVRAQDVAPTPDPDIRITAEPMVGGIARPGEWAAFRVHLENDGPAVEGELRVTTASEGNATFSLPVHLATGARQDHILETQATWSGGRFRIDLVEDGVPVAGTRASLGAVDPSALTVAVIAERAARLMPDLRAAASTINGSAPFLAAMDPADLPRHVATWASVDRVVRQDVAFSSLSLEQLEALTTWIAVGGDLVIVGGPNGLAPFEGLPDALLPFRPDGTIDAAPEDLEQLLGALPVGATGLPALAGDVARGTVLATSGGRTIAARVPHGRGSVTLIGFDPTADWLAGTAATRALWSRMLRPESAVLIARNSGVDGDGMINALSLLPSVTLPPMDQLLLLFLGYVVLLGPATYLVLRRMDRREWAWVVMPALALVFTGASYLLGVALRGTDVIVNELAVVRGGAGAEEGVADAYIGVFSPSRTTFDIALPGALIAQSTTDQFSGSSIPFDVQLGDPARLRDFQVGYGSLRGFRAKAAVPVPRVETALQLTGDRLSGTVTNASDEALEGVALLYGNGVEMVGDLAPGQTATVEVTPRGDATRLVRSLFQGPPPGDVAGARSEAARMTMIRQLSGEWSWGEPIPGALSGDGPVLLAWRSGPVLDLDIDTPADRVGEALFLLPVGTQASGSVTLADGAIGHTVVGAGQVEVEENPFGFYLDRGTFQVDYRPTGFDGRLTPTELLLELGQDRQPATEATGDVLAPLPEDQQPDQADPMPQAAGAPRSGNLPALQLFDRVAERWVELAPMTQGRTYSIASPERYVDAGGGLLVRYVVRQSPNGSFGLAIRLTGIVE